MISPQALQSFLARPAPSTLGVRGKSREWLLDLIRRATGVPLNPKTPWTGSDRDQRQLEAIAFALVEKQVLLHYAPRTGKTRISLDWFQHLRSMGQMRKGLAIAHAPIGVDEWEDQAPRHSNLRVACVRSGPCAGSDFLSAIQNPEVDVVIIAPPTLQSLFSEKRLSRKKRMRLYPDKVALREATQFFDAIAVDEIHGAMRPESLRHQIIAGLAEYPEWRLGLTGTPLGRNPFGLWGQTYIIDRGKSLTTSYFFFEAAFGVRKYNHFSRSNMEYVFDKKKMPILQEKLRHMTLTCTLEEIQDVQVIPSVVKLHMTPQQRAAYRELIDEIIASEREGEPRRVENIFVRLRQVSSGYRPFTDEDGNERLVEFPNPAKQIWLEDLLANLDPGTKVLVFHEFVNTGERLERLCAKLKVKHARLWGGTKDRRAIVGGFQQGRTQVLVANHGAGGTGIDLSAADYLCVYESPVAVIARQQMLMRPMARSRPLLLDDLVCSPVEERILKFHEEGKNLLDLFTRPRELARQLSL